MPNRIFIFGITVLAVVIMVGGASWAFFGSELSPEEPLVPSNPQGGKGSSAPDSTPSESPSDSVNGSEHTDEASLVESVKDAVMAFVKSTRNQTAQFMADLGWIWERSEDSGNLTYVFYASYWTVTVEWQASSNPVYNVVASYSSGEVVIVWQGTYQNGTVKETRYSYTPVVSA